MYSDYRWTSAHVSSRSGKPCAPCAPCSPQSDQSRLETYCLHLNTRQRVLEHQRHRASVLWSQSSSADPQCSLCPEADLVQDDSMPNCRPEAKDDELHVVWLTLIALRLRHSGSCQALHEPTSTSSETSTRLPQAWTAWLKIVARNFGRCCFDLKCVCHLPKSGLPRKHIFHSWTKKGSASFSLGWALLLFIAFWTHLFCFLNVVNQTHWVSPSKAGSGLTPQETSSQDVNKYAFKTKACRLYFFLSAQSK